MHSLSCSVAHGIFKDQGLNLRLASAGRFLTTEPPGKSGKELFYKEFSSSCQDFPLVKEDRLSPVF